MIDYAQFIHRKGQLTGGDGFKASFIPDAAFDYQKALLDWSVWRGRSAQLLDCGLGKTLIELAFSQNVIQETNKPVLILTPLAVAPQFVREGEKFGIECVRSIEGEKPPGAKTVVTNYDQLHKFDPSDFAGCVCDESSILKGLGGATQKQVTRFVSKMRYRLFGTATASPNDYIELGTSSEALGEITHTEMLRRFFKYLDDKGQRSEQAKQDIADAVIASDPSYYRKLSFRVSQTIGQWRLRHHAVKPFWAWVASWARACRKPSDLGFSDEGFELPPLIETDHIIAPSEPPEGFLFNKPAIGLHEERIERKRTLQERCEKVASLVEHGRPVAIWCQANAEGDLLEKVIPGAVQIAGKTPDEKKIEYYEAFASGQIKRLIIKPKIGAWGLNWQHCADVVAFPTHSFEQHYQLVRRCWRFGQKNPVTMNLVATTSEARVIANLRSKAARMERLFTSVVAEMKDASGIKREDFYTKPVDVPSWL